jgi:sterol desaturase/sphingolipid hydroxylase (fatty acid hydroxylase superfamily)
MEQFINDTLHIFGFELMSIQLFQYQNYHKPSLYFHSSHSDFIQWNVHRLLHTIPFLWKIHKTHTVLKKWGLRRILDTTGWNLLFTNQYCISYYPYGGVNLQDVFIVFHLDCYWSLEPCQLRLGLRLLKYIFNNPKMHIWHHSKKMPNKYGVNFGI